jgi:beta-lactamase class A
MRLFLACVLLCSPAFAKEAPCGLTEQLMLRSKHGQLQAILEGELRRANLGEALDSARLAVSLVDLTMPNQPAYAGVNDDVMMYAASLPKIAILLSAVRFAAEGRLVWDATTREKLWQMIVASNNSYASSMAETVGLKSVAEDMLDPRYCFYEYENGGLWLGRAFRKGSPTNRDPLKNLSHASSSRQAARFYYLLEHDQLVSRYWSDRAAELMAPPQYFHKFVRGLEGRRGVTFEARKSGSWRTAHSDSALVQHYSKRYILTAVSEHPDGEHMLRQISRIVDDMMLEGWHRKRSH